MALAPSIEVNSGSITPTGIIIGLAPGSDPNAPVELWRAADAAGVPDAANAVLVYSGVVPSSGFNVFDQLTSDTSTYWYRSRINGGQYGPSPYTDWVNLGAPERVAVNALNSVLVGDASQRSAAWEQQNARIGPQGNILPNPGFEDGEAFWLFDTGVGSIVISSAAAQSGNKYLKLVSTTGVAATARACDDVGRSRYFEVNTNDVVQWGGWAYRESGTANIRYVVELTDKDKLNPTLFNTSNQNTAAWVLVQAQTIVGAGKKYARFWAEIDTTGTGVTARFDDAFMRIALGAIYDTPAPNTLYEIRFANAVPDPDGVDGIQTFIDFVATTLFMRVGQTPLAIVSSTNVNPSVVTVTAHGFSNNDQVTIRGHATNTAINGSWPVTVLTNDTFSVPVAANGVGGATGHVVRLSLTIDSFGNLVVYAIVRAVQLVVAGIATFNGVLRSLAGTLVRSLQHSVTGEYGDTNINRIMLDANNVQVMGDAGTGTTNEAVRLGSHSIGTTTTRTTAAFDSPAAGSRGWTDPDGTDNGKNTIAFTDANGNTTIAAASRLYQKLGVTTDGDFVDAYDDNYKVSFRVTADYLTGGNPTATVVSTVTAEVSTNSGASWAALPGSWSVTAGGTGSGYSASAGATFSPTFVVTGAPGHVWFRLTLTVSSFILDSTHHSGTAQGELLCFATTYKGAGALGNYATTWLTAGSTFVRRNLKLFATANGSSETMPHAYLEPLTTVPVAANTQKGEVWLEDVTLGAALAYKDATKVVLLRNLVRLLNVAYNKTTTSTGANAVVYSYVLAASQLLEAGQMLRICIGGLVGATSANPISVNFGGTVVYTQNHANGTDFWIEILVYKTGANTQAFTAVATSAATVKATTTGTMAVTDTASITIDFRCSQAGAGTFTFRTISIELAYAPESVG